MLGGKGRWVGGKSDFPLVSSSASLFSSLPGDQGCFASLGLETKDLKKKNREA